MLFVSYEIILVNSQEFCFRISHMLWESKGNKGCRLFDIFDELEVCQQNNHTFLRVFSFAEDVESTKFVAQG